jgi:hypothetical protein
MRVNRNLVGFRLEELELARLKERYESQGFEFFEDVSLNPEKNDVKLDGFAYNPETKEEIIFIVRAVENTRPDDVDEVWSQIKLIREENKVAKIVLVSPRLPTLPKFKIEYINRILLDEIKKSYFEILSKKIEREKIYDLKVINEFYNELIFDYNGVFDVYGYAHLCFSDNNEFSESEYEIPFNFRVIQKSYIIYESGMRNKMSVNVDIKFDFE